MDSSSHKHPPISALGATGATASHHPIKAPSPATLAFLIWHHQHVIPPRARLIPACLAITASATTLVFLLLGLLHTHLGDPRIHHLDLSIQSQVHRWTNPALTRLMLALTFIGSIKVFIPSLILSLALLLFTGERESGRRRVRKRHVTLLFVIAIGGALILNETLKTHFHRTRPQLPWSIGDEHTFSYPSGHSLFSFVLYGLIAYTILGRQTPLIWRVVAAALAALMTLGIGLSRIYLGMHFPTDVLAGYITAAVWLSAVIAIDLLWRSASRKAAHPTVASRSPDFRA
jgi:undecaprenyl-diphosphatase